MSGDDQASGLHIDSDWKAEAAREKERLAEEEAHSGAPGGSPGEATFSELVNLLAMQAVVALGGYQGPGGERIPPNPLSGKHFVDLLDVLEEKTKGNLTDDEKKALNGVLHELRMQYVAITTGGAGAAPPAQP